MFIGLSNAVFGVEADLSSLSLRPEHVTELVRLSVCYRPHTRSNNVVVWPYFVGFFSCLQLRVASRNNAPVLNCCKSPALFWLHNDIGHSSS